MKKPYIHKLTDFYGRLETVMMIEFKSFNFQAKRLKIWAFPSGTNEKMLPAQRRIHKRHGFHRWVWKTSWRRAWKPTTICLPGESHGQRSLAS